MPENSTHEMMQSKLATFQNDLNFIQGLRHENIVELIHYQLVDNGSIEFVLEIASGFSVKNHLDNFK